MTDKPQPLSAQIRALISPEAATDNYRTIYRTGRDDGLEAAAALADAATPAEVVEAMERALRHADQVSRDLGWHRIYDETGPALAALTAWRDAQ